MVETLEKLLLVVGRDPTRLSHSIKSWKQPAVGRDPGRRLVETPLETSIGGWLRPHLRQVFHIKPRWLSAETPQQKKEEEKQKKRRKRKQERRSEESTEDK